MESWKVDFTAIPTKVFTLLLFFVLQGCTGTSYTASSDVTLETGNDEAIVIFSFRTNNPRASRISAIWRRFDVEAQLFEDIQTESSTESGDAARTISINRYGTVIAGTGPTESVKYLIYKVKPGSYALDYYEITDFQQRTVTNKRLRPKTVTFPITDGEILYIGNFLIDVPKAKDKILGITEYYLNSLAKFRYEGEDKAAVEEILATTYQGLDGPVSFRKVSTVKLKLPE